MNKVSLRFKVVLTLWLLVTIGFNVFMYLEVF